VAANTVTVRDSKRFAPRAERWFFLNLYWLISGYSLRGLRTVFALLMLLAVATVLIAAVGFPDHKRETPLIATIVGTPPCKAFR